MSLEDNCEDTTNFNENRPEDKLADAKYYIDLRLVF
jgi:hypothetical protein